MLSPDTASLRLRILKIRTNGITSISGITKNILQPLMTISDLDVLLEGLDSVDAGASIAQVLGGAGIHGEGDDLGRRVPRGRRPARPQQVANMG